MRTPPVAVCLFAACATTFAADKGGYHLFNPTPRELMRELATDRPDQTESPYSVDAGHFQVEADIVSWSRDRSGGFPGTVNETGTFGSLNMKAGLFNNVDFQVILDSHVRSRTTDRATAATEKVAGIGDLTTRLKLNLWGNDGGPTALAVMPFVKFPAAGRGLGNNSVEGGVAAPFALELPAGFGLGAQTEIDVMRDEGRPGHHVEWINSVTVGRDIVGALAGYFEWFTVASFESGAPWEGYLDVGLTYGLTDDIQLDAGCNFGVTDSAPDYNPFLGITARF